MRSLLYPIEMQSEILNISLLLWPICLLSALFAGAVKGVVGFGMPMLMISLLGSVIAPDLALAGLILPTVVSNFTQFASHSPQSLVDTVKRFRWFLIFGGVALVLSSQLVVWLPTELFLGGLGVIIVLFSFMQAVGINLKVSQTPSLKTDALVGGLAGTLGGFSGVWGPPTVAYLTAMGTEKEAQMRIQGLIYFLGAVLLTVAHLKSGILNATTAAMSAILVLPAMLGMFVGGHFRARIDQAAFRKATVLVLFIAGANLIRRAVMG